MVKINLGCGPVGKEDWINIDWGVLAIMHKYPLLKTIFIKAGLFPKAYNVKWPKNLKLYDCRKDLPFRSGSIDFIYTSHFLEHLRKYEAQKVAKECYRALRKNGLIRIAVPDLELLVRKYFEKDIAFFKKAKAGLIVQGANSPDAPLADYLVDNFYPDFYKERYSGINKLMNFFVRPHLWQYDYDSLKDLFIKAGFKNIERRHFREGRVPDLDVLDVFPEVSLYAEAEK